MVTLKTSSGTFVSISMRAAAEVFCPLIPRAVPLRTYFGPALELPKIPQPSAEELLGDDALTDEAVSTSNPWPGQCLTLGSLIVAVRLAAAGYMYPLHECLLSDLWRRVRRPRDVFGHVYRHVYRLYIDICRDMYTNMYCKHVKPRACMWNTLTGHAVSKLDQASKRTNTN